MWQVYAFLRMNPAFSIATKNVLVISIIKFTSQLKQIHAHIVDEYMEDVLWFMHSVLYTQSIDVSLQYDKIS